MGRAVGKRGSLETQERESGGGRVPGGSFVPGGRWPEALKYKVYLATLIVGASAALFSLALDRPLGESNPFDRAALPLLAALCASLAVVLYLRKKCFLRFVERALYGVLALFFLVNAYYFTYVDDGPTASGELAELFVWIPSIYLLAYLIFGIRKGWVAAWAFYAALVAIGLPHILSGIRAGEDLERVHLFAQLYLSNAVLISLAFVLGYVTKVYQKAYARSEAMKQLANTDFLTGIANRRGLHDALVRATRGLSRHDGSLSLVLFDLDHFKRVNDVFGHETGDRVLKETARLIEGAVRSTDESGRWGGEEFLVLAPDTSPEQAIELALRLRQVIRSHRFEGVGSLTASFGVSSLREEDTPEALLRRADAALYRAKARGRDRVEAVV